MADYGSLPFQEQITFFRDKVSLPTASWTDIWEGMHSRAFVVAGAMRTDLLSDLRGAVDRAISQGTTLEQFRKDFDQIVQTHGWSYKGGRSWRTRTIYETNLRQSYNAGRDKQMADPALRKMRPYGVYRHGGSADPRPEHLSWDGMVLPLDDPWWDTHTPQNGWGCSCKKFMASARDLERMGLKVAEQAPPMEWEEVTVGTRGPSPRTVRVPKGIDPGFAYNPGQAAWGKQLTQDAMDVWRAQKGAAWERLNPAGWAEAGRDKIIPTDTVKTNLLQRHMGAADMEGWLKGRLKGAEQVFDVKGLPLLVNAETLASHIDPNRSEYLPLLFDAIEDPYEVWLAFERHKGTGKVELRSRLVRAFDIGNGRIMLVVAQAKRGLLEAWTMIPMSTSKASYFNQQRYGELYYGR